MATENPWRDILADHPQVQKVIAGIGNSAVIEIPGPGATVIAKAEWQNPGGTVKDRTAMAMMLDAIKSHGLPALRKRGILEYSGGSLAVSLARLCKGLQVPLNLVLSSGTARSTFTTIEALSANVELVDRELGFYAVMERAMQIAQRHPSLIFLFQHRNVANIRVHREMTGSELLEQVGSRKVGAWVAAIGSGGTLAGVDEALRRVFSEIKTYGVTPVELPYGSDDPPNGLPKFSGSGGLGCGRRQFFVEEIEARLSGHFTFSRDACLEEMACFLRTSGIKIGSSAAANLMAARALASELAPGILVATVFPDAGTKEEWQLVQERGFYTGRD